MERPQSRAGGWLRDRLPELVLALCSTLVLAYAAHREATKSSTSPSERANKAHRTQDGRRIRLNYHEQQWADDSRSALSVSTSLDDVGGLKELKDKLYAEVIWPLKRPELGRQRTRGVLLYGPPGTGKTMLAKALARESGAAFLLVRQSRVKDKYYGESSKLIRALFSAAAKLQPAIIFIDEVESLLGQRQPTDNETTRAVETEFMQLWEGFESDEEAHRNVLVLGATNLPEQLDTAVLRRFTHRFEVKPPSLEGRLDILQKLLLEQARRTLEHKPPRKPYASVDPALLGFLFSPSVHNPAVPNGTARPPHSTPAPAVPNGTARPPHSIPTPAANGPAAGPSDGTQVPPAASSLSSNSGGPPGASPGDDSTSPSASQAASPEEHPPSALAPPVREKPSGHPSSKPMQPVKAHETPQGGAQPTRGPPGGSGRVSGQEQEGREEEDVEVYQTPREGLYALWEIASAAKGYTGADLKGLVELALGIPCREVIDSGADSGFPRPLALEDLRSAVQEFQPAHAARSIRGERAQSFQITGLPGPSAGGAPFLAMIQPLTPWRAQGDAREEASATLS